MSRIVTVLHWFSATVFFCWATAVAIRWLLMPSRFADGRWPEGILLILALITVVASLSRQLPFQNVLLASVIIGAISGAAVALGALTGIPFGPVNFADGSGAVLPLVWIVFVLASRGAARLVLSRWRRSRNYGFALIGLTTLLVLLLDFEMEPMAAADKRLWTWGEIRVGGGWYGGTPWTNYLGWGVTTLVILAFATPALIKKKPEQQRFDYYTPAVWAVLHGLFVVAAIARERHLVMFVGLGQLLLVAAFGLSKIRTERRLSERR